MPRTSDLGRTDRPITIGSPQSETLKINAFNFFLKDWINFLYIQNFIPGSLRFLANGVLGMFRGVVIGAGYLKRPTPSSLHQ